MPSATECVPCLEAAGDVPRIRRFDQATKEGIIEISYLDGDREMERAVARLNQLAAPNEAYELAAGESSQLERDERSSDLGFHLSEAFEDEVDDALAAHEMSEEGHRAISEAQKQRWAQYREQKDEVPTTSTIIAEQVGQETQTTA